MDYAQYVPQVMLAAGAIWQFIIHRRLSDKHQTLLQTIEGMSPQIKAFVNEQLKSVTLTPGPKGDPGIIGPVGEQGPPGMNGKDGLEGLRGLEGPPGRDGRDGRDGRNGNASPSALPGLGLALAGAYNAKITVTVNKGSAQCLDRSGSTRFIVASPHR